MLKVKIIAVDFDGTLCENKYPEIGNPNRELFTHLREEKKHGARIILWTCRSGEELESAVKWCELYGLKFDAINENVVEAIEEFGGDTRKIFAHEYIDDRATYAGFDLPYVSNTLSGVNSKESDKPTSFLDMIQRMNGEAEI